MLDLETTLNCWFGRVEFECASVFVIVSSREEFRDEMRLFVFFLGVVGAWGQLFPGDDCEIGEEKPGICVLLKHCQVAIVGLTQSPKVLPQNCGFQGKDVVVCCPIESKPIKTVGKSLIATTTEVTRTPAAVEDDALTTKRCDDFTAVVGNLLTQDVTPLIVGGENATNGQYPHMAALGFGPKDDIQWLCGGTLISDRFILTAGHCLHNSQYGNVSYVRLGDVLIDGSSETGRDFRITRRILHPEYMPPLVYNDIALLELHRKVKFTPYIKPACLFSQPELDVLKKYSLEATGWGLTDNGGPRSTVLQTIRLPVYPFEECSKKFGTNRRHNRGLQPVTQLCIGGIESKDTCQGDSGGPVQIYLYTKRLHCIVGITSFGKACGIRDIPGVYTKVSHYIPWIESVVWAE